MLSAPYTAGIMIRFADNPPLVFLAFCSKNILPPLGERADPRGSRWSQDFFLKAYCQVLL